MNLHWKALDLVCSFLGKVSIVIMMGGMLLRAPGFTSLWELWPWVIFHTVCCAVGFGAHIKTVRDLTTPPTLL